MAFVAKQSNAILNHDHALYFSTRSIHLSVASTMVLAYEKWVAIKMPLWQGWSGGWLRAIMLAVIPHAICTAGMNKMINHR